MVPLLKPWQILKPWRETYLEPMGLEYIQEISSSRLGRINLCRYKSNPDKEIRLYDPCQRRDWREQNQKRLDNHKAI